MALKDLISLDILNRNPGYSFVETPVDSMFLVELKDGSLDVVTESQKLDLDDCYLNIRSQLGLQESVLYALTTAQISGLSGIDLGTEIFNTETTATVIFDGTIFTSSSGASILRNGSFDTSATEISINTATTFDTTTGDFGFIIDPITNEKVIKTYTGEIGVDVTSFNAMDYTGVQRNIFVYVDVEQTPPVLELSFSTPDGQPEGFVYIGNFDLTQTTTPFDTLTSANQIVYTAYNQPSTGALLDVTKQNYRLNGLIFNGLTALTLDLGITAGEGLRVGSNTIADYKSPDRPPANTEDFINALNRQYVDPAGLTVTILEVTPTLTTTQYAPSGVLTAISPSSRFQIMYLFVFPKSWSVRAMLGTAQYATISEAEKDVNKDPIGQSEQTHEAILTTALIVCGNCTDLQDPAEAKFISLI